MNRMNWQEYIDNLNRQSQLEDIEFEREEKKLKKAIRKKGYSSKKFEKYVKKKLGDYWPSIKYLKHANYARRDIIRLKFNEDKYLNKFYTIKKIQKISNEFSKYLKDKGIDGKIMTTMKYGDIGWRSGFFDNIGENVYLFNPDDYYDYDSIEKPKSISSFVMYIALGYKPEGGHSNDNNNDCLYICLKYYIFDIEKYFKFPSDLKKFLKLKRNDKIPLNCIDEIEKKLKTFQINVRGDHIRSSTIKSDKIINLILKNEHYEVEKPNKKSLTPNVKYEEKLILLYDKVSYEGFDGVKKWKLSKKEKNYIIYNPKSKYILVNREKQKDEEGNTINISIEEEYKQYIEIAIRLKEESKGLINLFKNNSYHDAALDLFDRTTKFLNAEEIKQDETEWIKKSSFSSIIWCEKYEGELYKYDVKSLFPYLMTLSTLKFPIKRGEFLIINNLDDILKYGIYKCQIKPSNDKNIDKLFRFNKHNLYPSNDINNARKLNLNIELIMDGKPNFLHYSRDKLITFNEVFKPFVDIMFDLKEKRVEKAKNILNILWGSLCEVNKNKQFCENSYDIDDDDIIIEMYPCKNDEDNDIMKTTKINNFYKTNFARLCPFLLSKSRSHMTDIIYPIREHVHRIQTDGFLSDIEIHKNINVKLGELKYEGYTINGKIDNCINKVNVNY